METLKPHLDNEHQADRRMRELYRYFRPTSQPELNSPAEDASFAVPAGRPAPVTDAAGAATTASVAPDSLVLGNPNKTLNSFAQLAALQLNVDRALISVSDRKSQFILAEATPSSNINRRTKQDRRDGSVWPGYSTADTAWGVCEATIGLPPSDRDASQCSFLVVDNLGKDERFKRLPFVQREPQFRFYAGTPLTTDNGINIGCFFVLDRQPRAGLTTIQRETMGSLATLVIDYLRVSRQSDEGRRASRLSRGLSYFVEGSSSFVDNLSPPRPTSLPLPATPPSGNPRASLSLSSCRSSGEITSRRSGSSGTYSISSVSEYRFEQGSSPAPITPLPDWWPGKRGLPLDESQGNAWAFRRAGNLLRESLDLGSDGGVVFLEAGNPALDFGTDNMADAGNPASVLAISTSEEPFAPRPGSRALYPAANLGVGFLHQLLRRYSKGKLWSFHRDGMVSSSDEDKTPRNRSRATKASDSKTNSKNWKNVENAMLNRYFPSASQVLFVPLWNAANSQWFAGCFCWNTVETHVFSSAVELSSVLGFGTSIMAECSRLESQIADRQKGDFIGSISHELRSPLHGILAAAEFLSSTTLNEFQDSLLETVNACGRTLLDTINQVLDFSKIASLERKRRHHRRLKEPPDPSHLDKLPHLDSSVAFDLGLLTEEVVEGVCVGHAYGQRSTKSEDSRSETAPTRLCAKKNDPADVEVVIDLSQEDWIYQAQPGALRRIIMNVFGNAMKYTDAGCVSVHLSKAEKPDSTRSEDLVILTVTDTGKGMSEGFLSEKLYTPFAQEDSLVSGTGLGLSIVRSLVKALNGNISIHSRPGEGTVVKISLSLAHASEENSLQRSEKTEFRPIIPSYKGRVAILGVDTKNTGSWGVIARYLTEWYGLELVSWPSPRVDMLLADERELVMTSKSELPAVRALLILTNPSGDHNPLRSKWSSLASFVDILRQPCGPYKLGKSISRLLNRSRGIPPLHTNLPERSRSNTLGSQDDTPVPNERENTTLVNTLSKPTNGTSPLVNSRRKPRVLVVDDNTINLNLMLTYMKKLDLPILDAAENGSSAVQAVQDIQDDSGFGHNSALGHGYDIIFMDISMPVMNGFEATRAIRLLENDWQGQGGGRATIIALTGLSSPRDESEALASGVDLFLTKPVSLREVGRVLGEWEGGEEQCDL